MTPIVFPHGPRDREGKPTKMGLDDYLVSYGPGALRELIESRLDPVDERRTIEEWRNDMQNARLQSLGNPGIYLDRSTTGAGKSHADLAAIGRVTHSLVVFQTHKECKRHVELCGRHGIGAAAYPQISEETCKVWPTAEKVLDSGLSPSRAICPWCEHKTDCVYQRDLKEAENACHSVATHYRASMSFGPIADGKQFVAVHEDCIDLLRPSIEASNGFEDVAKVADTAITLSVARYIGENPDRTAEYFFRRMYETANWLAEVLTSIPRTTVLQPPVSAAMPHTAEKMLWDAILHSEVYPAGSPMRIAMLFTEGEICEMVVFVNEAPKTVANTGDIGEKRVKRSICAIKRTVLPPNSVIWLEDATAELDDIEALVDVRVHDKTPPGSLQHHHPRLQVLLDITKSTSGTKIVGTLRTLLSRLPYDRVGVITHRKHVPLIKGTSKSGEMLESAFQHRIVKVEHFRGGDSRGSNEWIAECDLIIVLGTPRVPPDAIMKRLIRLGLPAAAARTDDWREWSVDYWSGKTTKGDRVTVTSRAYRDHDWYRAQRSIVRAEQLQAAGRGRTVNESGIPVLVVTTEELGLTLLDFDPAPLTKSQVEVLDAIKQLSPESPIELPDTPPTKLSPEIANKYYIGLSGVSSSRIATFISKSDSWVRDILVELETRGYVRRIGERGGWLLLAPPHIDLYAAAGLPPPPVRSATRSDP